MREEEILLDIKTRVYMPLMHLTHDLFDSRVNERKLSNILGEKTAENVAMYSIFELVQTKTLQYNI